MNNDDNHNKCPSCQLNHDLLNCPIVRFVPDQPNIIKNIIEVEKKQSINGKIMRRERKKSFNSLIKKKEFKKAVMEKELKKKCKIFDYKIIIIFYSIVLFFCMLL